MHHLRRVDQGFCRKFAPAHLILFGQVLFAAVSKADRSAKAGRKVHSNNDDLMYLDILQKDSSKRALKLEELFDSLKNIN